jgi:hypothetical protein
MVLNIESSPWFERRLIRSITPKRRKVFAGLTGADRKSFKRRAAARAFGGSVESPKALDFPDFARFFAKNRFPLFRSAL